MITLGIDCGTQSLKTVALDGDSGKILASASEPYGLIEGLPTGHAEQDPAICWDRSTSTQCDEIRTKLGGRERIMAFKHIIIKN